MESPVTRFQEPDPDTILAQLGVPLTALTADSRHAGPQVAFAAYPGSIHDGRAFIAQAIGKGAPAVIWDDRHFLWDPAWQVPNVPVTDLRRHVGAIAGRIYGEPSHRLRMFGVTGTNGKTSVAHWIAQALGRLKRPAMVVGTLGNGVPGSLSPSLNTTPDAVKLQQMLAQFVAEGAQACAMEVSSHGLHQGRVNGCHFDVAVLTNLSRDHLDYHGSMEAYAAAKAGLFAWPGLKYAILNLDDEFGRSLAVRRNGATPVGYGFHQGEVMAEAILVGRDGIDLSLNTAWGRAEFKARLLGRFNAANLLAALAALLVSDVSLADACDALSRVTPPEGRMQMLGGDTHPLVVVDYAHTPDALEKVLATLRPLAGNGRVICLFGCGGNRDRGKRPLMGRAASAGADLVFVTSDNPRNEDPAEIIADITAGMGNGNTRVEANRARAIFEAVGEARVNDIVLIAGKGHENYQEVQGQKLPFSDVEVAHRALEAWS
jgi:UDP-N-acetylmuramoyl-L-alanyl-D-glutamate--2,6-diaminopimelate ligase